MTRTAFSFAAFLLGAACLAAAREEGPPLRALSIEVISDVTDAAEAPSSEGGRFITDEEIRESLERGGLAALEEGADPGPRPRADDAGGGEEAGRGTGAAADPRGGEPPRLPRRE